MNPCCRWFYLTFKEGYTAAFGDEWMREELCNDALRLGRMLAKLLPEESEVHGLLALTGVVYPRRVADQPERPCFCRNMTVLCGTTHRSSEEWLRSIARRSWVCCRHNGPLPWIRWRLCARNNEKRAVLR